MTIRKDQELHDKTCVLVAQMRFKYPNSDHQDWHTIVNHPQPSVSFNNGKSMPDVVVLDSENHAQILGEIETEDTVNEESVRQWQEYSTVCKWLYVYVPKGYGALAKKLGSGFAKGFREYSYQNGQIIINVI